MSTYINILVNLHVHTPTSNNELGCRHMQLNYVFSSLSCSADSNNYIWQLERSDLNINLIKLKMNIKVSVSCSVVFDQLGSVRVKRILIFISCISKLCKFSGSTCYAAK